MELRQCLQPTGYYYTKVHTSLCSGRERATNRPKLGPSSKVLPKGNGFDTGVARMDAKNRCVLPLNRMVPIRIACFCFNIYHFEVGNTQQAIQFKSDSYLKIPKYQQDDVLQQKKTTILDCIYENKNNTYITEFYHNLLVGPLILLFDVLLS